ncbi:MAG TPA: DUF268 domain-containing protein [Thermodesulfobacteriota bacterium]|nr:DUF268 domain-containing protein [Thermodesulfobacteriota bacterium]
MGIAYKKTIQNLKARLIPAVNDTYSSHFNTPIKFKHGEWYVNERIIETVFVFNHIGLNGVGKRALEFGCTRSHLALQLASLGYEVCGIDLREYKFTHPGLKFYQQNLLYFEDGEGFDYVTAVSSIEHIGLGAYGEDKNESDLHQVTAKLAGLLKPGGKLIVTVPFGQEYEDEFLRSFTYDSIISLFPREGISLVDERFYYRTNHKFWSPCGIQEAQVISNSKSDRGSTGVNCVGCFAWEKACS